jgi:uncharacterized protein YydD (DUF2326 family)
MTDKLLGITNRAMLPAGVVVACWFGTAWILDLKKTTDINTLELANQKSNQEKIINKLDTSGERLARIEEAIQFIKSRLR